MLLILRKFTSPEKTFSRFANQTHYQRGPIFESRKFNANSRKVDALPKRGLGNAPRSERASNGGRSFPHCEKAPAGSGVRHDLQFPELAGAKGNDRAS